MCGSIRELHFFGAPLGAHFFVWGGFDMESYRVALFGHSIYNNPAADARLERLLQALMREHPFVEFFIGRHGDFDISAAATIKRVRTHNDRNNTTLTLVLPYHVADEGYYQVYYDDLCYPLPPRTHFKAAIIECNRWMIEQADLVIELVQRNEGAFCFLNEKNRGWELGPNRGEHGVM